MPDEKETNPRVLAVIITSDIVVKGCYESVCEQDYQNIDILFSKVKSKKFNNNYFADRYINIALHRNIARDMVLANDPDYVFWVDSDVIVPKDAVSKLLAMNKGLASGWYGRVDVPFMVAGNFVDDQVISLCEEPSKEVTTVDYSGLGCCLMKTEILKQIKFESGVNRVARITGHGDETAYFGDDVSFFLMTKYLGYKNWMHPEVICNHIDRKKEVKNAIEQNSKVGHTG